MVLFKTLTENIPRPFVKYPYGNLEGTLEIYNKEGITKPRISIVIPTLGVSRSGYLSRLLDQIKQQTFQNYEVILIKGDTRQGRAINCGVAVSKGEHIVIFDDDTKLGSKDILERMVGTIDKNPFIGMAGVANTVPESAPFLVRKIMNQVPRRSSPVVSKIIDSDLAEHPCCIIPKKIFIQIGGENELIPRGLDPYLRQEIRNAGYRVVVLPKLFIHHLPPEKFILFVRQFYSNGKMAAYVNKFYPDFVIELSTEHGKKITAKRSVGIRIFSYIIRLLKSVFTFEVFNFLSSILYLSGYIVGFITLQKNDV